MGEASLVWQGIQGAWPQIAAALAGLAFVAIIFSYRQASSHALRRLAGFLCKVAVFALLLIFLLEPTSVRQRPKKGENDVLLLADNSASLGLKPGGAASAGDTLKASWKEAADRGWIHHLQETFRVHSFTFDERLHERADGSALDFTGMRSVLGGSMESLMQRYEKQPVAAMVLFTDGNATDAAKLEALLAAKPLAPIYPVVLGLSEAPRDIALQSVEVTQTPFEDSPVAMTARIAASGFAEQEISLVIRDEAGKTVQTEKHRLGKDEKAHTFQVRFRPEKMGLSFFTVWAVSSAAVKDLDSVEKLVASSGELTMENNRRVLAVDRRTGPYRVLYVSGRPNWDYKFMRRALEADDEVKLVGLIRMAKREPKFEWRGREGEMSNPLFRGFKNEGAEETQRYDQAVMVRLGVANEQELPNGQFPKSADELFGAYRAVILDDIEAGFFTQEQMDLLERYVSVRGGSLLMLGGQECFRLGGYDHTPVGRMLPVYLDNMGSAAAVENARFNLTREGWLEPWMRLRNNEADEEARMAAMPGFFSVNQTTAIKPGASILATVTDAQQKAHPAWVVQRYGSGHVAAVTVGDVWRWGLSSPEAHADMDKAWRQLLRHLVVDVPDRIELQTPISSAGSYELVNAQVRVRDKAFRPQDDATVKIEAQEPDGTKLDLAAEPSADEPGLFESSIHARHAGAYRVKATVKDGTGTVIGETSTGWALNPAADEFASLTANRPLLERIAKWSGGRVLALDDLDAWAKQLPDTTMPMMETRVEPLWDHWWVLAVLVALLGTEWWMRQRQGWR
jgi:uncharacterized membrane protein